MSDYQTITCTSQGGLATITLNRPDDANGLNPTMAAELRHAAKACEEDRSLKVVVLTGSGRFFCAGGDVKAMADAGSGAGQVIKNMADDLHGAVSTLARMRAPLITAVNGTAAGAGFSMAIAGDLSIAVESAGFTMAYSKIGLSPDGSSTYFLPRLVGMRKAQELMFTNRKLSAQEAVDWGLINRVVADDQLELEVGRLAELFLTGSADSNAAIKQLLLQTYNNGLETQMEIEGRFIADCARSKNGQEGISAFVAKRKPEFD